MEEEQQEQMVRPLLRRSESRRFREHVDSQQRVTEPILKSQVSTIRFKIALIGYLTIMNFLPGWNGTASSPQCVAAPVIKSYLNYFSWLVQGSWLLCMMGFYFFVWNRSRRGRMRHEPQDL